MGLAEKVAKRELKTSLPMTAMIEFSDHCNEACVHCYQVHGSKREMDTNEAKRVLDKLADSGVLYLTLSGGEITLRKDFLELVEYSRQKGFFVNVYTNGLRIDAAMARRLGELALRDVQLSLYSIHPELHDGVTRVPGSWEKTVNAIKLLVSEGVPVVVKSPAMKLNQGEHKAYKAFVTGLGARPSMASRIFKREDGSDEPLQFRFNSEEQREFQKSSSASLRSDQKLENQLNDGPCGACSRLLHIEADGEIRPCALLNVPLGNVIEQDISEVYAKGSRADFVTSLKWKDIHGCRDCDLRSYCRRCYASALDEGGDALGPYQYACRMAALHYEQAHSLRIQLDGHAVDLDALPAGPFQKVDGPGHFVRTEDRLTDEDVRHRAAHPWLTTPPGPSALISISKKPNKINQSA